MTTQVLRPWRRRDTPGIYLREAAFQFWNLLRMPGFAVPTLLFPTLFYLFFGLLFGNGHDADTAAWMLTMFGTFGIMAPALFGFGVGIAMEREHGILALKRVMPLPPMAYFFAKAVMAMLFALIIVLLLSLLGALFGHVHLEGRRWLALITTLVLGTLPFCALGLSVGLRAGGQSSPAVINLIYLPMSLLSGLWVPLRVFPHWLQEIAPALPAYHLAQLAIGIVRGDGGDAPVHAGYLVAFTAVFLVLAVRGWRRIEDR